MNNAAPSSSSSISIRGASSRVLGNALRGAGIVSAPGMEVDGNGTKRSRTEQVGQKSPWVCTRAPPFSENPLRHLLLSWASPRVSPYGYNRDDRLLTRINATASLHHSLPCRPRNLTPLHTDVLYIPSPLSPHHRSCPIQPSTCKSPYSKFGYQSGRQRQAAHNDKPYKKIAPSSRRGRGGRSVPGRLPPGTPHTPPTIASLRQGANRGERENAKSRLNEKLAGDEMKAWLRSRMIAEGVLDMSDLRNDQWIKSNGIIPPGHPSAPPNTGIVFWRLIDQVFQKTDKITIHTLSLANNHFHDLRQLDRLPFWLPDIRALDLSGNPVKHIVELDHLLASGEKKGKANAGMGSLKSLVELKLNDCTFREVALTQQDGDAQYKHEILRRFPGLRILDGVSLERVIFPIERKPKIKHTEEEKRVLVSKPLSFPVEIQSEFFSEEAARNFAMAFCAKYFPLFDSNRADCLPAYASNALISIAANTLSSRSAQQIQIYKTRGDRPHPVSFEAWTNLPSRNFFRSATSIQQRMESLKSTADPAKLMQWWDTMVPKTEHPLTDPAKWCFECWVLDSEGGHVRLCLMIQGQFRELPSGTYRSFSRTFILTEAPEGSPQVSYPTVGAGFPGTILSDTMIVHSYLGSGAFDGKHPLSVNGITIQPPSIPFGPNATTPGTSNGVPAGIDEKSLVDQVSSRTGMNEQYATMCLSQNGWDLEAAIKNFEEIKLSIPREAFQ
nr:nuclear RNA export factor 1/2 [Cryptococcus depauperatus CBS 7841]